MKIKEKWKLRVSEFKQMDSRQRWSYFKTYYLLKCIIALIFLAMVLHFGFDIRQNRREVLASGCLVDVEISPQGVVYLTDDYLLACHKNPKASVSYLSTDNTLSFSSDAPLDQASYEMALIAQISVGEYSYMILDEQALGYFVESDFYADLGKVLSKEQYHHLEWRLNYQNMQDGKYPVALCLDKTDIAGYLQTDASKAYLVFTNVNQDIAKNRQLVDYLFP